MLLKFGSTYPVAPLLSMRQESNLDTAVEVQSGSPEEQDRSRICNNLSLDKFIFFSFFGKLGKGEERDIFIIICFVRLGNEHLFDKHDRSRIFKNTIFEPFFSYRFYWGNDYTLTLNSFSSTDPRSDQPRTS